MNKLLLCVAILSSTLLTGCSQNEMTSVADFTDSHKPHIVVRHAQKGKDGLEVTETTYYSMPEDSIHNDMFLKQFDNYEQQDGCAVVTDTLSEMSNLSVKDFAKKNTEENDAWKNNVTEEEVDNLISKASTSSRKYDISEFILQYGQDYLKNIDDFIDNFDSYYEDEVDAQKVVQYMIYNLNIEKYGSRLAEYIEERYMDMGQFAYDYAEDDFEYLEYIADTGKEKLDEISMTPEYIVWAATLEYDDAYNNALSLWHTKEAGWYNRNQKIGRVNYRDEYYKLFGEYPKEETKKETSSSETTSSSTGGYKGTLKFSGGN